MGAPEVLDPSSLSRGPDLEFGIRRGDRFEIRVSGSGWTYLGESAGQEGIAYEHRRFQDGDAIFALSAERAGDYLLDFRRLDPLLGVPESKAARIVVTDAAVPLGAPLSGLGTGIIGSVTGSRVSSPSPVAASASSVPPMASGAPAAGAGSVPPLPPSASSASSVPVAATPGSAPTAGVSSVPSAVVPPPALSPSSAAPAASGSVPPAASSVPIAVSPTVPVAPAASSVPIAVSPSTVTTGSFAATAPASPVAASVSATPAAISPASDSYADLLRFSRDEMAAGRFENARRNLERLVSLYPNSGDEPWYLLGRVYEEPGPLRDIRKAHAAYKRVRDEFPESAWWQDASDRVAAIERRYFDIR